jgi:hypothetical protein
MTVVTTLDVNGLTAPEYRAVMDELGVETRAEPGIYVHITNGGPVPIECRTVSDSNSKGDPFGTHEHLAHRGGALAGER